MTGLSQPPAEHLDRQVALGRGPQHAWAEITYCYASVTRAISTEEIRQLPQVGRDPYELARLTPGIFGDGARGGSGGSVGLPNTTGPGGSNSSIFQTENQVPISANGQRLSRQ